MYVYFIKSGNYDQSPIKIGVTGDVPKRLSDLQVGNPEELTVLAAIKVLGEDHAYWIERNLHKFFKEDHIRGEWFRKVNMKKAEKICDSKPLAKEKNREGRKARWKGTGGN